MAKKKTDLPVTAKRKGLVDRLRDALEGERDDDAVSAMKILLIEKAEVFSPSAWMSLHEFSRLDRATAKRLNLTEPA